MIPFLDLAELQEPYLQEIDEAVRRVVHSGRFVGGPEVEQFEDALQNFSNAPYAVAVSNGLDALRLILRAWIELGRLRHGDEVIVPANTYVASVLAIVDNGLTPILAEPSIETLNLDTARLGLYLTPKTRAVMPVHLYGRACWDDSLRDFASRNNLLIIEDNAQAIGAVATCDGKYGSRMTGALGDAGAFSFYPTKNLGALGDAGAVVTHDQELAKAVRALANYGSDRRYHNIYRGFNCRMDPIQAAVLNVKLKYLDDVTALRRKAAQLYDELIDNSFVTKPLLGTDDNVWHQYPILTDHRDALIAHLKSHGIATDIHYATPPHLQPALADLAHGALPITERIAAREVSLPIAFPSLATAHTRIKAIAEAINSFK